MTYDIRWVKLEKYEDLTGDTADSVKARIKTGKWVHGAQCKVVDGRIWVNLDVAQEWVEKWQPNRQLATA